MESIIMTLFMFVFIMVFTTITKTIFEDTKRNKITSYFKNNVVPYGSSSTKGYKDVPKEKLNKFNINDIDTLKDFVYDMFYKFETAYNNLDYNVMKELSTNELYHNYYTGISLDLKTGKKRIINDIEKKKVIIYGLDSSPVKQIILAYIEIEYYNYTIDKDGDVISGSRYKKMKEKFEVILRKEYGKEGVNKCPNCGASIAGNSCPYCRTKLEDIEFKISSIKKIVDIEK